MRKILLTLSISGLVLLAGCLKDKQFENQEYGIQITEVKGVAFIESPSSPIIYGINSQTTPQIIDGPLITLEQIGVASSPVTVTITINSQLVIDAGYVPLPVSAFTVNALTVTIPAGERTSDFLKVTVLNSSLLNATTAYGVGLTISSVDQGYKIAQNMKNVVIAFNIKNQYDGKYTLKGQFYHPSYPFFKFTTAVEMHTSGPNSVKMYFPPFDDYLNPFSTGSAITGFDLQDPDFTINPTTNAVTVQNVSAGAVTFYAMGIGYDNLGYNSRWVPATKTMYVNYGYNLGAGGAFVAGSSREWIDTLIYTGPR